MMLRLRLIPLLVLLAFSGNAQITTVSFKPDSTIGKDAIVATSYGCTPFWSSTPYEVTNSATGPELDYMDWTLGHGGCSRTTLRSLIVFDSLSTIPVGSTIISATLNLFGVPSSSNFGNSSFPGSGYGTTNEGWVRIVTSSWNESSVTWNTQPSFDTTNQAPIPATNSQFNWSTSVNVTALIQDIITSGSNNGLTLHLDNENYYRSVLFASSDHTDSTLWPELIVTYSEGALQDTCQAGFTWSTSTASPNVYQFGSVDTSTSYSNDWTINGNNVSNALTMSNTFPSTVPSSYQVCLSKNNNDTSCVSCADFCHGNRATGDDYSSGACNSNFEIKGSSLNPDSIQLIAMDQSLSGPYQWQIEFNGSPYMTFSGISTPLFKVSGGGWYTFKLSVTSSPENCYTVSSHHCFTDSLPSTTSVFNPGSVAAALEISNIAPNPASDVATINFNRTITEDVNLSILNLTGKEVYRSGIKKGSRKFAVSTRSFSAGAYLVRVTGNGILLNKKIIKN